MSDVSYRFQIRVGSFSFEIEGDRNFVERTLTRYEGRFLPRFQQLLDKMPSTEIQARSTVSIEETRSAAPQKAEPDSEKEKEKGKEPRKENKRSRRRSDRRRGTTSRHSSSRVISAPQMAPDQKVIKQPYIPPDFGDDMTDDEVIPEPVPLLDHASGQADEVEETEIARKSGEAKDREMEKESTSVSKSDARDKKALKELFDKMKPRTHHEKIMVFGYFLQVRQGMKEFGTGKIKTCYDLAGVDPAGNINQVLNHASRTGFVMKSQRGRSVKYSLTSKGKQFIERGLQNV